MGKDAFLWGKSRGLDKPYPLVAHMIDTAVVAEHVFDSQPRAVRAKLKDLLPTAKDGDLRSCVALLAGLHDLGKATPAFQFQSHVAATTLAVVEATGLPRMSVQPESRHDHLTQLSLPEALEQQGFEVAAPALLKGVTAAGCALGGHHGRFNNVSEEEICHRDELLDLHPDLGNQLWSTERANVIKQLMTLLGVGPSLIQGSQTSLVLLAGLTTMSDWVASSAAMIGKADSWPEDLLDLTDFVSARRKRGLQLVRESGLGGMQRRSYGGFESRFGFPPRPLQQSLETHLKKHPGCGIVVVAAPMGIGKTEAAFLAAELMGEGGVFVALPTTATSDAMFPRLVSHIEQSTKGDTSVALVHGMASVSEAAAGLPDTDHSGATISEDDAARAVGAQWLRGSKRSMLASAGAGTVDQVLLGALPVKFGYLRLFALAGKTLILDEVHTLTPYMAKLTEVALEWLGALGTPVVVLSATMPRSVSTGLVDAWCRGAGIEEPHTAPPYPGWLHVHSSGEAHQEEIVIEESELVVEHEMVHWQDDATLADVLKKVLEPVQTQGSALLVLNTVADSQRVFDLLTPWAEKYGVVLRCLHSRFRQRDRRAVTEEVLKLHGPHARIRPERYVLVSTQVVEQSLDIDFDLVVSAAAPVAPLLQRAGRGHRHSRDRSNLAAELQLRRLVVLAPVDATGANEVPYAWTFVYPRVHITRTDQALSEQSGKINIPSDVQRLVDWVYEVQAVTELEEQLQADKDFLNRHQAGQIAIPTPANLHQLRDLTSSADNTEGLLATRLGANTRLILPIDAGGTLDGRQLSNRPNREQLRLLLDATLPVRPWSDMEVGSAAQPAGWSEYPLLEDIVIAEADTHGMYHLGGRTFLYDTASGWRRG